MQTELPNLTFLPVDSLLIHERHDDQRTRPLILRIRSSGVFRNPPIVSPLPDGSERYMVLDGANRTTAVREMGFPHILVQVIKPEDPGLVLQNWNHVVWEMNPGRFLDNLRKIPGLRLTLVGLEEPEPNLEASCGLALVKSCNDRTYSVCPTDEGLEQRVRLLVAMVDSYKDHARLDRTTLRDIKLLKEVYPQFSGLVIFPHFKVRELMFLCGSGCLLPAGITRFMISPRALHVNYPLEALASDQTLEEKNAELYQWLQERLERKAVRYYAEATFLYDE